MSISTLKKNVVANFASYGWTVLTALIVIPLYIKLLGVEAWGVIGIFLSLQTLCVLLDFGLSATLNREMARLSIQRDKAQEMHDLVRTLEFIYWSIGASIGVGVIVLAPLIANRWVQAHQLSPETITHSVRIMGVALALQWPFSLYFGGLVGLQRQVLLSGLNIGLATLRSLGAVLILWKISPTLQAFFFWQIGVNLLQTGLTALFFWRSLPKAETSPRFQSKLLRDTWRFTAGISGITVMSVILTQMDKVILSRLLSLEMFGYYILAGAIAMSIHSVQVPVFSALFPKFTQLVSLGNEEGLKQLYHHSCQLMSVLILPVTITIAFFSKEIVFLWTGNLATVANTHVVLSILVVGAALNGLLNLPCAVQLAYGWTRLTFNLRVVAVVTLVPLMVFMTSYYGAIGAALIYAMLNGAFVLVSVPVMHRRVLKGEQWRWYFEDVGLPLIVALGAALFCLAVAPTGGSRIQHFVVLAIVALFVTGATSLATPFPRHVLVKTIQSAAKLALARRSSFWSR